MSIVLDALKKAKRDRREETELPDETIFRGMDPGDRPPRKGGDDNRFSKFLIFGCLGVIAISLLIIGIGIIFLVKDGWFLASPDREGETSQLSEVTDDDYEQPPISEYAPDEAPVPPTKLKVAIEKEPTPTPEPESPVLKLSSIPIATQTPSPTPSLTPTPSPTPTETPTPTPTPTPSPTPTPFPSRFQNPEDYGLKIDGVMWDENKPEAVINSEIVSEGSVINGFKIKKITRESIEMEKDERIYRFKYY